MSQKEITFSLDFKGSYILHDSTFTSVDYKVNTDKFCLGTREGNLVFGISDDIHLQENKLKSINILNEDIKGIRWLNDERVAIISDDMEINMFDIHKESVTTHRPHSLPVKCVMPINEYMYYTCGRDKLARGWDLRCNNHIIELSHEGNVTCMAKGKDEIFLYTTNTPGTNINYWDLRYTKRGSYFSKQKSISRGSCVNLDFYRNNVFCRTNTSELIKISETCLFSSKFPIKIEKVLYPCMIYNPRYDCLFVNYDKGIASINENKIQFIPSNRNIDGFFINQKKEIFAFRGSNIVNLEIIPHLIEY